MQTTQETNWSEISIFILTTTAVLLHQFTSIICIGFDIVWLITLCSIRFMYYILIIVYRIHSQRHPRHHCACLFVVDLYLMIMAVTEIILGCGDYIVIDRNHRNYTNLKRQADVFTGLILIVGGLDLSLGALYIFFPNKIPWHLEVIRPLVTRDHLQPEPIGVSRTQTKSLSRPNHPDTSILSQIKTSSKTDGHG